MEFYEILNWGGLISLVASCCCVGLIGIRNSVWYGPRHSPFAKLKPVDLKIAKVGALFLVIGLMLFLIGWLSK